MFRKCALFLLFISAVLAFTTWEAPADGVTFRFKNRRIELTKRMGLDPARPRQRGGLTTAKLDTLSNVFYVGRQYIEIVRQDHAFSPTLGLALGFEFDEANGQYPYTPARAVVQLKDFGWGGIEFSRRDTSNYTGVSDAVSDDITVEVDTFYRDTIVGRFSGLLISGAGPMAPIEEGAFRVRVFRK